MPSEIRFINYQMQSDIPINQQTKPLITTTNDYKDMDRRLIPEFERQKGGKLISEEKYDEAIKAYSKAIMAFQFLIKDNQLQRENIRDMLKETIIPCYSNITLCYLKKQDFQSVMKFASRVIQNDKQNTKAFYRRGIAYKKLKKYEDSIRDLERAKLLDSSLSGAVDNILREISVLQKNQKAKEKKIAQKLIEGFGEAIKQQQKEKIDQVQQQKFFTKVVKSIKNFWRNLRDKLCPNRGEKQE